MERGEGEEEDKRGRGGQERREEDKREGGRGTGRVAHRGREIVWDID